MTKENNDALINALTRVTSSRTGAIQDINQLQLILKAEGLYKEKIDNDFGERTATGMMEEFRRHPALLNNAAPWLIRAMEKNGFGEQMRDLVASNPELRQHLVESALQLVDNNPKAYTEAQTKLSLLNLYNYKNGIDGIRGNAHIQAVKDLRELAKTSLPATPPATPGAATPAPPQVPVVVAKAVPGIIEPPVTLVSQNIDAQSFSAIAGITQDQLLVRLGTFIGQVDPGLNTLRDSFGRSVTDGTGRDVRAGDIATQRNPALASFIGDRHKREGLAILDLINRESCGGNYNIAAGEMPGNKAYNRRIERDGDFTDMTINQVMDWQEKHKKAVGRFQIVRGTMGELVRDLGLSGNEKFDEQMQDTMGLALLARRGYVRYLTSDGSPSEERRIMRELAGEWAALPRPDTGLSHYHGINGNHHLVSRGPVIEALRQERTAFQEYMASPAMAVTGQQRDFDDLIELSNTLTKPKIKSRASERDMRSGAEDYLSPTPVLASNGFTEMGEELVTRMPSIDDDSAGGIAPRFMPPPAPRRMGMGMAA